MDRELLYREKMKQLFGDADSSLFTADPEFAEILNKFVFGEVYNHGKLTDKERILITLCALTAGGIFKNFKLKAYLVVSFIISCGNSKLTQPDMVSLLLNINGQPSDL